MANFLEVLFLLGFVSSELDLLADRDFTVCVLDHLELGVGLLLGAIRPHVLLLSCTPIQVLIQKSNLFLTNLV